ncbi:MAG: XdhC family protein [Nitrospirae bacterium]|nr:XdhC family protein [Nitrospirota bacterium]
MQIYEEILRLNNEGKACALATIVQGFGSSPQKAGAKMLVKDDGSVIGTLGGGCLDAEIIQVSLMTIKVGSPHTVSFDLNERSGGLVCGGRVFVYIEPMIPEPEIFILGAGHVGRALSKCAGFSGFRVTVIDDREEYANTANLPDADRIFVNAFADIFSGAKVTRDSYIVIATRGHNHDLDALRTSLRTEASYIGLLGSKRKRAVLFRTLRDEGFTDYDISRIITPVGLSINSVTPEEIAVSIMAQIIQLRRGNDTTSISDSSCSRLIEKNGAAETASPPRQ